MQLEHARPEFFGELPGGALQTPATLALMSGIVRRYKTHRAVRGAALDLTAELAQKDWPGEVRALFEFVRDRIRYVRDVRGVETVQTPDATLDIGAGDCDDKATLLAALLESIGYQTRFAAVGSRPGRYSHVFVEARERVGAPWIALDATEPVAAGWRPPGVSYMRRNAGMYLAGDISAAGERELGKLRLKKLIRRAALPHKLLLKKKRRRAPPSPPSEEVPTSADVASLDGLGKFKLKKLVKKVGKIAKKVAPIAAGFIPVVGGAVQSALESRAAKKAQKKADAQAAAAEAAAAAAAAAPAAVPTSADVVAPGGTRRQQRQARRATRADARQARRGAPAAQPRARALLAPLAPLVTAATEAVAARAAQAPEAPPPPFAPSFMQPQPSYAAPSYMPSAEAPEYGADDAAPAKQGPFGLPPWAIPAGIAAAGVGLVLALRR